MATTTSPLPAPCVSRLRDLSIERLLHHRVKLLGLIPDLRADGHIDLADQCERARDEIARELEARHCPGEYLGESLHEVAV